jgi:uncharacterized membrane protein
MRRRGGKHQRCYRSGHPSLAGERLKGIMIALAVSYPLLAHLAVVRGSEPLLALSLAVLALAVLLPGLARGRAAAIAGAAVIAVLLAGLARSSLAWLPLYAPSVITDLVAAALFARTLSPGHVPLIERFVRLMHAPGEPIDPAVQAYARRLTLGWALLFALLALASLLLALCATPNGILLLLGVQPPVSVPQEAWSLFANVLEYALVAGFFVIEYAIRRRRFPQQPFTGLRDFTTRLLAVAPAAFDPGRRRAGMGKHA